MKGIKKSLLIVLIFLVCNTLFAVSFSSSILSVSSDAHLFSSEKNSGFLGGFFPLEAKYRYKTVLPSFLKENGFSLNLDFASGIKERELKVSPESGETLSDKNLYQVHYINLNLDLSKAIISEPYMAEDILALHFSLLADYENAFESFIWLDNPVKEDGAFTKYNGNGSFSDKYSSYKYVPELGGNRRLTNTGMGLSLVFNWKEETEMTKDGLWGSVGLEYMPSWMPFGDKKGSDYVSIRINAGLAMTLLELSQMSFGPSQGLDALSVFVETDFDIISAWGKNIPQLAVEKRLWNITPASSRFIASNRTDLVIKGFQIMNDLYPSITLFSDMSVSFFGGINGSEGGNSFVGSIGARIDFNIFSMFSLYGEVGYVYKDLYNRNPGLRYSLGAKVRV